jgi:hypothetical protein
MGGFFVGVQMKPNNDERLYLTARQWKIIQRALLKFSLTTADDVDVFESSAEIDTLYYRVKRRNEQREALKERWAT